MTSNEAEPRHISRDELLAASPPDYLDHSVQLSTFCLIGFAAIALLAGSLMLLSDWQQNRYALRATGEVIEVHSRSSYTLRYVDDRNVTHTAAGHLFNLTGVSRNGLRPGERLPVLYQRGKESQVSIENTSGDIAATIVWLGVGVLPLIYVPLLRRRLRRHRERYARLQRTGVAASVESVRTQPVAWGKFMRWALVATWRDPAGRPHETLGGPFHYDPMPVDASALRVLADTADPARSVIDPETLPPLERARPQLRALPR